MFGRIGKNTTTHSEPTNPADVNKLRFYLEAKRIGSPHLTRFELLWRLTPALELAWSLCYEQITGQLPVLILSGRPVWTRFELPSTNSMKRNTKFKPGVSGNEAAKWKQGQSGNPGGTSKLRRQFEEGFTNALITLGSPEEAAQLLWQAARKGEAWAIQELCRRFAPEAHSLRLIHEVNDDAFDYSKLSNEQIQQFEILLTAAKREPDAITGREGEAQPA